MKKIILIFIFSLFLFLSVAFIVIKGVRSLIKADKEISKMTLVYEHLTSARLALRIAIINQRDYMITSETIYLNRYHEQKGLLDSELNNLRSENKKDIILNSDSLDLLEELIGEKIILLDSIIELKQRNHSLNEIEKVFENETVRVLDLIKKVSDGLQLKLENENANFRLTTTKNSNKITQIVIFGFLIGFVLLLYSFFSLLIEIKRRIKIEKELKHKSDLLNKANKTKDRFFSILAHDLRSPFNAILGLNELIVSRMQGKDNLLFELGQESLNVSKNTFNLLENLLQWARSQSGDLKALPETFNLKTTIEENINLYNKSAEIKGIRLVNKCLEDIEIFADKNMISTVIRNLINNAIKYSYHGGQIEILIGKVNDKEISISIKDNGVGIPEENSQNLFKIDQKIQTKGTSEEKGTGLGLILCKDLIEKNNGKIWVESKENNLTVGKAGGTTFTFSIPKAMS